MADIGATHTRCALVDDQGNEVAPEIFDNVDFTSLIGILSVYLPTGQGAHMLSKVRA